jgi:hypothetical protein
VAALIGVVGGCFLGIVLISLFRQLDPKFWTRFRGTGSRIMGGELQMLNTLYSGELQNAIEYRREALDGREQETDDEGDGKLPDPALFAVDKHRNDQHRVHNGTDPEIIETQAKKF